MNWLQKRVVKWAEQQEARIRAEYQPRLTSIENSLKAAIQDTADLLDRAAKAKEQAQQDFQYLEGRLADRRVELAKEEDHLKEQIRLLEAKARPDDVWVSAYTAGFNRALDMLPEFSAILRGKIEQRAIDQTLERLNRNGH